MTPVLVSMRFAHVFDHEIECARPLQGHRRHLIELGVLVRFVSDFFAEATSALPGSQRVRSCGVTATWLVFTGFNSGDCCRRMRISHTSSLRQYWTSYVRDGLLCTYTNIRYAVTRFGRLTRGWQCLATRCRSVVSFTVSVLAMILQSSGATFKRWVFLVFLCVVSAMLLIYSLPSFAHFTITIWPLHTQRPCVQNVIRISCCFRDAR